MTTDHRAAAERMLADADEWTAQAGELSPEASELSCLAYAAVHALLAIHDTLTDLKPEPATYPRPSGPSTLPDVDAADRYAANEAKQREEAADGPSEALMCPECGHDIDSHGYDYDRAVDLCDECPDTERCPTPIPSQVARALIEQAVKAERERLVRELRSLLSTWRDDSAPLAFELLATRWEQAGGGRG